MPLRKKLGLLLVSACGLHTAVGFMAQNPNKVLLSTMPTVSPYGRDATIAWAAPVLLPTKPMPPVQPAGLGSKFYLPAFLPPWIARDTVRTKFSDDIFFLEQSQTFVNVSVNIRSTVIRLKNGDLFVHAPVAPTPECVSLIKELGEVAYVVLPVTAIEHKVYMARFASLFPKAKIYVAPGQFSWPVDIPLGFRVDGVLTEENKKSMPFIDEIDYTGWIFRPFTGSISEVAFFHRKSRTLLVTDAIIWIDDQPPEILRQAGVGQDLWKKMALQACFLGPPNLDTFQKIKQRLIVSPVIRVLVVSRAKKEVAEWIKRVCEWKFERVIPAHFSAPIKAGPVDLQDAYAFLEEGETGADRGGKSLPFGFDFSALWQGRQGAVGRKGRGGKSVQFPEQDLKILKSLNKFVSATGLAE